MNSSPKIDVCIGIGDACAMQYMVTRDYNEIDFHFGDSADGFHYIFEATAVRRFIEISSKALSELEAARAQMELEEAACG